RRLTASVTDHHPPLRDHNMHRDIPRIVWELGTSLKLVPQADSYDARIEPRQQTIVEAAAASQPCACLVPGDQWKQNDRWTLDDRGCAAVWLQNPTRCTPQRLAGLPADQRWRAATARQIDPHAGGRRGGDHRIGGDLVLVGQVGRYRGRVLVAPQS